MLFTRAPTLRGLSTTFSCPFGSTYRGARALSGKVEFGFRPIARSTKKRERANAPVCFHASLSRSSDSAPFQIGWCLATRSASFDNAHATEQK
jgi:hypothetical protein